jgi:thiazole biosynthesis enzyme
MELDEITITKAIIEEFTSSFLECIDTDVALVGGGPANLVAARVLARAGIRTVLFERKLEVGGGIWGGGMMMPRIVVQEEARRILDDFNVNYHVYAEGYYVADSIECAGKLVAGAVDAGARIFNLISVEDVMIRESDAVTGLVINRTTADMQKLHVDPITIRAGVVIDGTGHDAEICSTISKKIPGALQVVGEKPMWADVGERTILNNTKEVYPGLIVAGMAANAVAGAPRMGPIFGGMLLSGEKAARLAAAKLGFK